MENFRASLIYMNIQPSIIPAAGSALQEIHGYMHFLRTDLRPVCIEETGKEITDT